ncbi:MAG: insulinase family protein [Candidatus Eiseniibacteriota bacterium]
MHPDRPHRRPWTVMTPGRLVVRPVPWLAATLCMALLALLATASLARPPAADAPFQTHVLPNGLTVLLSPSHAHPVIALSGFVTTGGRTEDEYYQGSLHYIEHLVFKGGSPHLKPTEFRKRMSLLGREAGGWTWDDEIHFGFEVPRQTFVEALGVYREAMLDLEFEPDWFEDEKRVVLQEMSRGREEPVEMLYEAWGETAYEVHPYRRAVIGTEKAIRELEMQATERYYRERFTPNHMILSIAGDFEPDSMLAWVEAAWGAEEPGPESFELGLTEPEQRGPRTRLDHLPQATDALLLTGVVTAGGAHDDTPALELLAVLLEDDSFGLPQYLLEQEKWVTSISVEHYAKRDYGDFRVFARMEPAKLAAVTAFVEHFLLEFDVTALPERIFEQARQTLLFHEATERVTAADRASRHGFLVSRRGVEAAAQLIERYEALTPEVVQAAKQRWLTRRRLVTTSILPDDFEPAVALAGDRRASERPAVTPHPPELPALPELDVSGALRPAGSAALPYEETRRADGVVLITFANGLRLLVQPTDASPLVAMTARVLGGQWVEPDGQDGINLFVAELGMRQTRRWDRASFAALLAARSLTASAHLGDGSRANTSRHVHYRDAAGHHVYGLEAEWPTMLAILKETVFFPELAGDEVEKLREDLITTARQLEESNLELTKQEFYLRAYAGHPYGHATFGTETTLASITAQDLAAFHAACWTPDRVVVSVVGDVEPDTVAAWIASRWADLDKFPARPPWAIDADAWTLDWSPPAAPVVLDLGKNYWTVNWGRPGASAADPEFDATRVLARMAGNDHFYKYVYEEGVSYRSWIHFWPHLGPGAWILENDVNRERFDAILAMFEEDLNRYATEGFARREFEEAVRRMVNGAVLNRQSNRLAAWQLAVAEGNGVGFERVTGEVERLRAVTFAEVSRLAPRIFQPDGMLRLVQQ